MVRPSFYRFSHVRFVIQYDAHIIAESKFWNVLELFVTSLLSNLIFSVYMWKILIVHAHKLKCARWVTHHNSMNSGLIHNINFSQTHTHTPFECNKNICYTKYLSKLFLLHFEYSHFLWVHKISNFFYPKIDSIGAQLCGKKRKKKKRKSSKKIHWKF